MRLLLVILITERLVHHSADFLDNINILMCEDMSELNDCFSLIANDLLEILLLVIGFDCNLRCKNQRKESIYHRYGWQASAIATEEASSFIIVLLTSVSHVLHHLFIKFVSEIVDGIPIKLNEGILVNSFKSQFIQIARSSQFLILKHFSHFVVTKYCILRNATLIIKDAGLKLGLILILLIIELAVP